MSAPMTPSPRRRSLLAGFFAAPVIAAVPAMAAAELDPKGASHVLVTTDNMSPTLRQRDILCVDLDDTVPSPPGIFLLRTGAASVPHYVEVVALSRPVRIRIGNDNPGYADRECLLTDIAIEGRVVGVWQSMAQEVAHG